MKPNDVTVPDLNGDDVPSISKLLVKLDTLAADDADLRYVVAMLTHYSIMLGGAQHMAQRAANVVLTNGRSDQMRALSEALRLFRAACEWDASVATSVRSVVAAAYDAVEKEATEA